MVRGDHVTIVLLIAGTITSFIAGYWLTGRVLSFALANSILDVPNQRSSHSEPTARGGGWGVVLPSLASVALACSLGYLPLRSFTGLAGGGAVIAATGWADDRRGLSAMVRFAIHVAAAAWLVAWIGGVPVIDLGATKLTLGTCLEARWQRWRSYGARICTTSWMNLMDWRGLRLCSWARQVERCSCLAVRPAWRS